MTDHCRPDPALPAQTFDPVETDGAAYKTRWVGFEDLGDYVFDKPNGTG